ncbi:nicotinate-nucleotide adenylyltransferase [Mycoplasma marinum]|uniref:Probable nicotinate-nucleotide adenylyltransferase n=1 Tax=Mycoplasma marinum TaxID=1937190 RepID=A0A4R0XK06_9MOLU|nr:nicotinate-nucleotide adenylyltransferase [Mycoplasma marinum]TCG10784.1 nicotinate (nicotinamide) nucleotide adenylyltransferase [Mycoplasma marinum]
MKIGIFGGSFNPVHKGHINVAKHAMSELNLDKLFFVPAYQSPFKSKVKYLDSKDRVAMLNLVKPENTEVSLFEINRKGTSYTIDTIKYFRKNFPNAELFLLIGTDNLYKLHKWKDVETIAQEAQICIFRRDGNFSKVNIKKYGAKLLNNNNWVYSSSNARRGDFDGLDDKVIEYIGNNKLLLLEIGRLSLSHKRHKHCLDAGSMAANLAKANKMDAKQAWVAALMHDITKEWSNEKHKEYLLENGYDPSGTPELIWHQWTGALWLRNYYRVNDEEIVQAIFRHSNADAMPFESLTMLDKIVYVADKLCEGRRYPGIQAHRELAMKDLDAGFKAAAKVATDYIIENYGSVNHFKLKKVGK